MPVVSPPSRSIWISSPIPGCAYFWQLVHDSEDPTLYVDQLTRFMEVSKGRAVAIGNVDATKFEKTTREEMEADVRRCIDAAARHSGFILSTSCEIPPRSNPEIVKWFMDAAHDFGRYERVLG